MEMTETAEPLQLPFGREVCIQADVIKRHVDSRRQTQGKPDEPCFALLWDNDLRALREACGILRAERKAVLDLWCELYLRHFRDRHSLQEVQFKSVFAGDLDAVIDGLLAGGLSQVAVRLCGVEKRLTERGVPFEEIATAVHLFEQSAVETIKQRSIAELDVGVLDAFAKFSRCWVIALAKHFIRNSHGGAAVRFVHLGDELTRLPPAERQSFHGIVGASPVMRRLYDIIEAVAATRGTILVVGETGTGKELAARAVHKVSGTNGAPFVALNCAALPRELIESELFGHQRGAFSGATADYPGLFRAAHRGTLLLDEVTEMPPETQAKLLRVLQERSVRPLGSTREIPIDVRVIASTNRNPEEAVREGVLRRDLYYRLRVNMVDLPRLRDRIEDLPLLVEHLLGVLGERLGRRVTGVDDEAMHALSCYHWPGNVRELMNTLESAITFARGRVIGLGDVHCAVADTPRVSIASPASSELVATLADVERQVISRALAVCGGNKRKAAGLLRISRKRLYARLTRYGIGGGA